MDSVIAMLVSSNQSLTQTVAEQAKELCELRKQLDELRLAKASVQAPVQMVQQAPVQMVQQAPVQMVQAVYRAPAETVQMVLPGSNRVYNVPARNGKKYENMSQEQKDELNMKLIQSRRESGFRLAAQKKLMKEQADAFKAMGPPASTTGTYVPPVIPGMAVVDGDDDEEEVL